jgi:hypothetical protein
MRGPVNEPGFISRLVFAVGCFVRLLVDARFAAAVRRLVHGHGLDDASTGEPSKHLPAPVPAPDFESRAAVPKLEAPVPVIDPRASARVLLALLQREGRFVDFLEQPVDGFSDADVGAAARVVHAGCKKALAGRITVTPILAEDEGARVVLAGTEENVTLAGAARSREGTFTVVHRGWRLAHDELPTLTAGHDGAVLQAAEVE